MRGVVEGAGRGMARVWPGFWPAMCRSKSNWETAEPTVVAGGGLRTEFSHEPGDCPCPKGTHAMWGLPSRWEGNALEG